MKPTKMNYFDLEAAKRGEPVITRDGNLGRVVCTDLKDKNYPVVALISYDNEEVVKTYKLNGSYRRDGSEANEDIFMAPKVREYWVNVYKREEPEGVYVGANIFDSKEQAEEQGKPYENYINTVLLYKEEV